MMPIILTPQLLVCHTKGNCYERIYIAPLTEEKEKILDDKGTICIETRNNKYTITPKDVFYYGEIDFNEDSEDYEELEYVPWFDNLQYGIKIPARYDFKTHTCKSDTNHIKYYETIKAIDIIKFKYGTLGKPDRCIFFKQCKPKCN